MSQAQTALAASEPETAEEEISLPRFVQGLLTVFDLHGSVGERTDNGMYLSIFHLALGNRRYDLELQRRRGNSHFPVVNLTFYPAENNYTLTDPTNRLPRRTRNKLRAFLGGGSPAVITRDQALIAAYVIIEYASKHARQPNASRTSD